MTDVAGIVNITHVAEIVKLTHVARILEASSMYDHKKIHTYIFFKNFQDFMLSNQFTEGKVSLEHHLHKEC